MPHSHWMFYSLPPGVASSPLLHSQSALFLASFNFSILNYPFLPHVFDVMLYIVHNSLFAASKMCLYVTRYIYICQVLDNDCSRSNPQSFASQDCPHHEPTYPKTGGYLSIFVTVRAIRVHMLFISNQKTGNCLSFTGFIYRLIPECIYPTVDDSRRGEKKEK